ncbi:MAG: cyclase family protein [Firmicutes bacterium]|nr:cyclase family protein [Bacillota bacterium]
MSRFVDLSHDFYDGMPGFRMKNEDGSFTQFTARIRPFMTHLQSLPKYQGKATFEITELAYQSSVGTYLDSPYHRYPGRRDISELSLEDVILPGLAVDVRGWGEFEPVGLEVMPGDVDLKGRAVLFNFGWDSLWGEDNYYAYPFISEELIDYLIAEGVKLVGVDTVNIDSTRDPYRPAHTRFLQKDILVVENLTGLDQLHGREFRFYAVPLKAKKVAAIPVRAFAELL